MATRWTRTWIAAALGVAVLSRAPLAGQRQAAPAAGRPAPSPAGASLPTVAFEKYTLPNGLDVILSQDKRLPLVAVNVWYHVGPANEERGRTGFAHLFEHMMFQGSKHVPPDTHFRFLESAGATGVNGTTDFDRTNYFETLPADRLELGLWLESDRMGYLLDKVDRQQLANQQDVVRNERRQSTENVPYGMAEEALMHAVFPPGHPYYANVIGSHEDIQSAKLEDVKTFFKLYYAPNNASLAIVGDFDKTTVKALVAKYFGSLKRGEPVPAIKAVTPPIETERRLTVADRVQLPRVYMAWLSPATYGPGDADADIAASILGGGRASRLFKRLVYEKQIAQNVSVQQESLALGSIFRVEVTARPGHGPGELEQAIDEELDRLRSAEPEAVEVARARTTIETQMIERLETLGGFGGVADRLNMYNHFLRDPGYLPRDIARYRAVTPTSVRAFASRYLGKSARVVLHAVPGQPAFGPEVPTPAAPQAAAGEGAEAVNADEAWRNTPPPPGTARLLRLAPPKTATLANGLTLILSQRPGLPIVAANLVVRTGSDANPLDKPGLASYTAAMLDQGTATRTAPQIADALAQIGARVGAASTTDATFVRGQSLAPQFAETLELMADIALRPSFPAEEVERQRANRLGQIVQQRESPQGVAAETMASVLYGARHPYGFTELGTEASVKAITRDDLSGFWSRGFVARNAALVVAGNISMAELTRLATKTFGAMPPGAPTRQVVETPAAPGATRVVIVDKPGSPQTQLRVAGIGAPRATPDFRAMQVMNTTLGGLFSSRINQNLREDHGYTYGANSQFVFRRGAGPFAVATGVRTEVTAPALGEIFKELNGMIARPSSAEELALAKDAMAKSLPGAFETGANAAASFSNVYVYDLGLDYYTTYAQRVQAVTRAEVEAAAKKYLQPEHLVVIAVGDRAKIQPEIEKLNLGAIDVRVVGDGK